MVVDMTRKKRTKHVSEALTCFTILLCCCWCFFSSCGNGG